MPFLDVADLLSDPDIAGESFSVVRAGQAVNDQGRTVDTTETLPAVGSIIPQTDQPIQRGPDQQHVPALIQVITIFRLRGVSVDGSGNQFDADKVLWNGNLYTVNKAYPWTSYGAGFVAADCSLDASVQNAPQ